MRKKRVLGGADAIYHCVSRVVDRRYIMGDLEKGCFMTILRKLEAFSGVKVLTYCLMDNHFHLLLQVPASDALDAKQVLERVKTLYGSFKYREECQMVERMRSQGAPEEEVLAYLTKYSTRMYDLCSFMRELKQRFTQWYNRKNERKGTLWEDRYKSVLVENRREALLTMAHYIDLNPVRAGLCEDPKDYRWCGYGAAISGQKQAGQGIRMMYEALGFSEQRIARLLERYRVGLAWQGVEQEDARGNLRQKGFDREAARRIIEEGGRLTRSQLLRCRVRYFSDGVALGSQAFVNGFFKDRMDYFGPKRKEAGRKMRGGEWDDLHTVRDFKVVALKA